MVSDVVGNVLCDSPLVQTPIAKFRYRRSSSRLSSVSNDEPEWIRIVGEATLCFENKGTSFLGVINCNDGNYYSIRGKSFIKSSQGSLECDCSSSESSDDEETLPLLFNITVKDHDDPTEHFLKEIHMHLGKECKFKCPNISFSSKQSFRGHRAQLEAQTCLGRGMVSQSDLRVYSGVIDISVLEKRYTPKHWAM